jgi:hypothetical protein
LQLESVLPASRGRDLQSRPPSRAGMHFPPTSIHDSNERDLMEISRTDQTEPRSPRRRTASNLDDIIEENWGDGNIGLELDGSESEYDD